VSSPFVCPSCATPLRAELLNGGVCEACGFQIESHEGIPVLVHDRNAVESALAEARASGRADWYTETQADVWSGPYRHHVRKRLEYMRGALGAYAPGGGRFPRGVDLGCGDGEHLEWLSEYVDALYGSDYNLLRLQRANAKDVARAVVMADLTEYPAADDSFDLVFCHHVIEHIPDVDAALREMRRILAPGGLALIGTPNEGAAFWRLAYRLSPESRRTTDHVQFFTAATLAERMQSAGFHLHTVDPIGWGIPHWGLDARARGSKAIDDMFEAIGKRLLRGQATSLYAVATK
jgi:SAM-dependent methyltransferase